MAWLGRRTTRRKTGNNKPWMNLNFSLCHILQSHIVLFPLLARIFGRAPKFQRRLFGIPCMYPVLCHILFRTIIAIAIPSSSSSSSCPKHNVRCYCFSYCPLYLSWTTGRGKAEAPLTRRHLFFSSQHPFRAYFLFIDSPPSSVSQAVFIRYHLPPS